VGLVVQVQRIADELVDIDLGRALETATVAAAVSATVAATVIATTATLAGTARAGTSLTGTAFARRPAFPGRPALSSLRILLNITHTLDLGQ